ncbi:hypothetical protein QP028_05670 [Corynebacterium suedekumii]|nr:hypothetical protein QP028_05670 [Corynebacterium suedekumii]
MPSMFPGMYADPNDPNRRPRTPAGDPDTWPASLRWSYWLSVAAAIVMVLAGLVMLTENPQAASDANPGAGRDLIEALPVATSASSVSPTSSPACSSPRSPRS